MWLLSLTALLSFTSCGGGSDEAKELLQRLLRLVGIPQDIVVNICQDDNENGFCESMEPQVSIVVNQNDTADTLWQKITQTASGEYLLDTYDPTKPILLELQDVAKVDFDNGKFTIPFNGFKNHENNETKELSILASMVDKNYFLDTDLEAVRNLNSKDTQDKFYAKLLDALETNINTLRGVGLNAQDSMLANLKDMANELNQDGIKNTLPQDLNSCGIDETCVNNRLETLSKKITISDTKANSIKEENRQTSAVTEPNSNEKGLLVSKEITYVEDTSSPEGRTSTSTYTYNSKNQAIKNVHTDTSNSSTFRIDNICTYNYDNKDRYISSVCEATDEYGQTTNSNTDVLYKDNRVSGWLNYNNSGHLSDKLEVLEWSGDKAIKNQVTSYNEEDGTESSFIETTTYTGDNPTHLNWTNTINGYTWQVDRKFDTKKTPNYYDNTFQAGYVWFGWGGKNNIIEEITTINYNDTSNTTTIKNEIQYNSSDMPTRIDSYTTYSNYPDIKEHSYTTYEYINSN